MDKDGDKQKTYVSTFRLALRPQRCVGKQNGLETSNRTITGNKLEFTSAGDVKPAKIQTAEAPHFKEPLRDCSVCDGGDVTFHGVITGSEPMRVSWLHNGVAVNSGNASFKTSVASLTLTQCSHGKAGVYTCVAENSAGKRSSSAVLQITGAATKENSRTNHHDTFKTVSQENNKRSSAAEGKSQAREENDKVIRGTNLQAKVSTSKAGPSVQFLDPPKKVEARAGEQAQLRCEFRSGSLPVACCWIYNKRKVVAGGPRTSVRRTGTQSSVEISQAVPEDAGLYTIVVQNRHGSAQHTVCLSVVDRPTPPSSQPIVSRLSAESLVLSWTGPSYDGGTAVLGYIVEVSPEVPNKPGSWTEISRCKNTSYHILSGLEPLGRYRFRVRAYNSVGISEPSQESKSVRMATAKTRKEEPESYVTVTIDTKHKVRDHYDVHQRLGVGKFGEVYRLTHKETGQESAAKFYRARTSKEKSAARKEIQLMNKLHHPKLVQCLAAYDTRSEMALIME